MKTSATTQAILDWLKKNPGHHTATNVSDGLGHARGSKEHSYTSKVLGRLEESGRVGSFYVNGKVKAFSHPDSHRASTQRTARQQPSARRHAAASLVGLQPAPPSSEHTAALARNRSTPHESVSEFLARGGRVERIQGFESIRPRCARPAWKAAA